MLVFYVVPFHLYFSELCIPPFFKLKHPIFAESRYPLFIRSIATHPNHIFFSEGIPINVVLESSPNVLELQINHTLDPLPSCIPSTLLAPIHDRFYFLTSLFLFLQI